jgi:hypothetical protein
MTPYNGKTRYILTASPILTHQQPRFHIGVPSLECSDMTHYEISLQWIVEVLPIPTHQLLDLLLRSPPSSIDRWSDIPPGAPSSEYVFVSYSNRYSLKGG